MEPWVRNTHIILYILNILVFSYSVGVIAGTLMSSDVVPLQIQYLFLASGLAIGGYIEAMKFGASRFIKWAYLLYFCAII